jgi:hypothetical protein
MLSNVQPSSSHPGGNEVNAAWNILGKEAWENKGYGAVHAESLPALNSFQQQLH